MPELREVFEMVTKQTEPDVDSWKEQQDRQRRTTRIRKIGTIAAVAALVSALVLVFALTRPSEETSQPAHTGPGGGQPNLTPGLDPQDRVVAGLDGSTTGTVLGLPEDAFGLSPSTDGTTIAFVTEADGENHIATIGTDGQGMQILGAGVEPAMSPDGSRIAFVRDNDIYVMNANGSGEQTIVANAHVDEFPQWSPDGTTIVYDAYGSKAPSDSGYSSNSSIMVVPSTGGTPTRIAQSGGDDGEPTYSPDGAQIAFRRDNGIWVMDADGSNAQPIAAGLGVVNAPRWSPDGTKIAFTMYTGDWRATIHLGVDAGDFAVEDIRYVEIRTGHLGDVGSLTVATFWNAPNWLPNDTLLINSVRQG